MGIAFLKKVLGLDEEAARSSGELGLLYDELSEQFSKLSREEIKRFTGFSGMLGKVSYADMEISEEEQDRMRSLFIEELNLDADKADLLLSLLVNHRVQLFSVEDYIYSRLCNEVCDFEEKTHLLRAMFIVAAADGAISQEEDAAIYAAAKSLRLSHKDFIAVRRQFASYLDVLKTKN